MCGRSVCIVLVSSFAVKSTRNLIDQFTFLPPLSLLFFGSRGLRGSCLRELKEKDEGEFARFTIIFICGSLRYGTMISHSPNCP